MAGKLEGKNRRGSVRQEVAFTLAYGIEEPYALRVSSGLTDDLDAVMLDLSDSGVAMITGLDLPRGTQLHIKFNFMNLFLSGEARSRQMEIRGLVISRKELGNGSYRVGICFNNILEADKEAIRNFVKRCK
jgi:c-di-GMP-binding flagellar brake protein YcgR